MPSPESPVLLLLLQREGPPQERHAAAWHDAVAQDAVPAEVRHVWVGEGPVPAGMDLGSLGAAVGSVPVDSGAVVGVVPVVGAAPVGEVDEAGALHAAAMMTKTAAMLAMSPEILVFDEATSALDPRGATALFALARELNTARGLTVLMTEHKSEQIAEFADLVVVLDGGAVVEMGAPNWMAATNSTLDAVASAAKPCGGSSWMMRRPRVRMMRQPPA